MHSSSKRPGGLRAPAAASWAWPPWDWPPSLLPPRRRRRKTCSSATTRPLTKAPSAGSRERGQARSARRPRRSRRQHEHHAGPGLRHAWRPVRFQPLRQHHHGVRGGGRARQPDDGTLLATGLNFPRGLTSDARGDLFAATGGNSGTGPYTVTEFAAGATPGTFDPTVTLSSPLLNFENGLAVDAARRPVRRQRQRQHHHGVPLQRSGHLRHGHDAHRLQPERAVRPGLRRQRRPVRLQRQQHHHGVHGGSDTRHLRGDHELQRPHPELPARPGLRRTRRPVRLQHRRRPGRTGQHHGVRLHPRPERGGRHVWGRAW